MTTALLAILVVGLAGLVGSSLRKRKRRRREAQSLASELLPEIRAILASSDASRSSDSPVVRGTHFELSRQKLPGMLPKEALFAVETFYQCAQAYGEAAKAAAEAFGEGSVLSLGDRIRAKDRRDRCLKDVYYTGEDAIQRLERIAGV